MIVMGVLLLALLAGVLYLVADNYSKKIKGLEWSNDVLLTKLRERNKDYDDLKAENLKKSRRANT